MGVITGVSNHPKIVYRSDTTASSYQMMQHAEWFVIQQIQFDEVVSESPRYHYAWPWRKSIDRFFDIVTAHINTNIWVAHG